MMLGSWTIEISHQVTRACQERGAQITKTLELAEKKVELVLKKQKKEKIGEEGEGARGEGERDEEDQLKG